MLMLPPGLAQGQTGQEPVTTTPTIAPSEETLHPGQRYLDRERERRLQQQRERRQAPVEGAPEVEEQPKPGQKPAGPCFPIDTITVTNVTVLKTEQIKQVVAPFEGTCMGREAINQALQAVTNLYVGKGYVTSKAYIPRQNLKERKLTLQVVEGTIEGFTLNKEPANDDTRIVTAFPAEVGDVLDLRRLEQGLDQMNRLQSTQAKLQLWPGEKPGGTIVALDDKSDDRIRFFVGTDNYGQELTGKRRLRLGFETENLLGLNESSAVYVIGSLDTNAVAGTMSIPWGRWTLRYDDSYSEYLASIGDFAQLMGNFRSRTASIDRLLYRDEKHKIHASFSGTHKKSRRIINDIELDPQKLTVARLGVRENYQSESFTLGADFTWSFGTRHFGAARDPDDLPPEFPHAQFNKLDGGLNLHVPLDWGDFRTAARAQWAPQGLYASEQVVLGDVGTVRGFVESPVSGESGGYIRNDLSMRLPWKTGVSYVDDIVTNLEPYAFADAGAARLMAGESTQWLAGAGLGLRLNHPRFSVDISHARPVFASETIDKEPSQFYINLQLKAF